MQIKHWIRDIGTLLVVGLLLAFGLGANGEGANINQSVVESGRIDAQTTWLRSGLSTADGTTQTAILATTEFACVGSGTVDRPARPTLLIRARFSDASQSVTLRYVSVYKESDGTNHLKDVGDSFTLTATSITDDESKYRSTSYLHDYLGGNYGRLVVVTPPGSGTVDLGVGSY